MLVNTLSSIFALRTHTVKPVITSGTHHVSRAVEAAGTQLGKVMVMQTQLGWAAWMLLDNNRAIDALSGSTITLDDADLAFFNANAVMLPVQFSQFQHIDNDAELAALYTAWLNADGVQLVTLPENEVWALGSSPTVLTAQNGVVVRHWAKVNERIAELKPLRRSFEKREMFVRLDLRALNAYIQREQS